MRRRYIYDKETRKLLPAEEWEAKYGPNLRGRHSWQIMPDIQGYRSIIDGSEISSRSTHRAHLKQHNCVEVGNEKVAPKKPEPVPGLKQELVRQAKAHGLL